LKQTFIDDRKGLFYKPKLTFWRCPSFGLKAVERENKRFPCEKVSFGAQNKPFSETLV
jgi:hypothetical protein